MPRHPGGTVPSESAFADDPSTVLDALSDAIVIVDDRMVITGANRAAANLVGVDTPSLLIGQVGSDWVHEPDRLDAIERLSGYSAGEPTAPVSLRLERAYGSLVWVEVTGSVLAGPEARVALSFRNVDRRHQNDLDAARVVQRSHSLVSAALMLQVATPDVFDEALDAVLDGVGSALGAEVVAVHEVEFDGGSMALRSRWLGARTVVVPGAVPAHTAMLPQIPNWVNALNTAGVLSDIGARHPSVQAELSSIEPAFATGLTLALQPGERLLGALTVGLPPERRLSSDERDFVEHAAQILGVALHRLRSERVQVDSEAMFRELFEHSTAIMYLVDPVTLRITDANEAATRFYGYERSEMAGMDLHELTVHTRAELAALVEQVRTGDTSTTIVDQQQCLANGDTRTVEIHSTPVRLGHRVLDLAIVQDVTELRRAVARLERLTTTDELTGALNRGRFLHLVTEELHRSDRYGHALTLLLLDLDHVKGINDRWGHRAGDAILVAFARLCQGFLRSSDRFARMGGEEFALLLPETGLDEAAAIAERIRVATEQLTVPEIDSPHPTSVSIGGAQWRTGWNEDQLFAQADRRLYRAKQAGRNRFEA
jgi:diguanylate cyclase